MPTQVNLQSVVNEIEINGVDEVVIILQNNLLNPLTIYTEIDAAHTTYQYGPLVNTVYQSAPSNGNLFFPLEFFATVDGDIVNAEIPTVLANSNASISTMQLINNNIYEGASTGTQVLTYNGKLLTMTGTVNFSSFFIAEKYIDYAVIEFFKDSKHVGSRQYTSTYLANKTSIEFDFDEDIDHNSFLVYFKNLSVTTSGSVELWQIGATVEANTISKSMHPPTKANWGNWVDNSSKWCLTAASLLVTFMGSSLENGGNCAVALFPSGSTIPTKYDDIFSTISSRTRDKYVGQLKGGSHCSYLCDEIQQYFFKTMDVTSISAPRIVSVARSQTQDKLSIKIQLKTCWEFISQDVLRTFSISPGHADLFTRMIAVLSKYSASTQNGLSGENGKHWEKIKSIASKAASDPALREEAEKVLRTGTKAVMSALPALLGLIV